MDRYVEPAFDDDIDVVEHIERCPPDATVRGVFFRQIREGVSAIGESSRLPAIDRRRTSFMRYPMRDFMSLAAAAAPLLHPGQSLGEGLRRLGWHAYSDFTSTMAGRVVMFAFGDGLDAIFQAAPKAYAVSVEPGVVTSERVGEGHWRFTFRDIHGFLGTYHAGVVEGAVRGFGLRPELRIRRHARECDADFELTWTPLDDS